MEGQSRELRARRPSLLGPAVVDIEDIPLRADSGIKLNIGLSERLGTFTVSYKDTRNVSIGSTRGGVRA